GWLDELEPDGEPGGYARRGDPNDELFFRRATYLRPGEETSFDLPASNDDAELDVHLGAFDHRAWKAELPVYAVRAPEPPALLGTSGLEGPPKSAAPGGAESDLSFRTAQRFLSHERVALPSRKGRVLRVVLRNGGPEKLIVGNPLVMKKVARPPRQLFV